tara:strand:+ start:135 stop:251 length:117 start_codon:yes stop_codon:yes gene_type:complete
MVSIIYQKVEIVTFAWQLSRYLDKLAGQVIMHPKQSHE